MTSRSRKPKTVEPRRLDQARALRAVVRGAPMVNVVGRSGWPDWSSLPEAHLQSALGCTVYRARHVASGRTALSFLDAVSLCEHLARLRASKRKREERATGPVTREDHMALLADAWRGKNTRIPGT